MFRNAIKVVYKEDERQVIHMTKQWNFIIGNKLITIYDTDKSLAEEKARALYEELQNSNG